MSGRTMPATAAGAETDLPAADGRTLLRGSFFDPEVDCILDIGGQDMKCIRIKDGTVDSVQLNEACF